ncbi:PKD domain-containing protein [Kitasatospora sp. MAP5-34]|uniref:PKD domain-containing protein n=1 Tax=Kitasatospora sp. MAP5-34 TaxID=3035102 RepID=UPI0024746567|nr:PKD domain-containing protein [Kitasatospora sp. MAP5-34]
MTTRSLAALAAVSLVVGAGTLAVPIAATAAGSTLYVNNAKTANCSDSAADAGTQAQPYCGVQAAANAAQPGDTVQVAAGSYGAVDLTHSGTAGAPIIFAGPPAKMAPTARLYAGTGPALTFDHVHDVVVRGLQAVGGSTSTGAAVTGSTRVTLDSDGMVSGNENDNAAPALHIDGHSSAVTVSRNSLTAMGRQGAVTVDSGATGVTLTTNLIDDETTQTAVTAVDNPGTVIVSNTITNIDGCPTAISLTGASTGSTIENNAVQTGYAGDCSRFGASTPVVVSAGSVGGTTYDYNTIESGDTGAPYNWAGKSYPSPAALLAATGHGAHDYHQVVPAGISLTALNAPLVDSADANAPGGLPTDMYGNARVDDPLVPNTGTGVGYYDRGSRERQDPYSIASTLSASKGPGPLTETVTAVENNPWHTGISSYSFDFGDGSAPVVSATPTATHVYAVNGTYPVTVTATTAAGRLVSSPRNRTVQVVPVAPLVPNLDISHLRDEPSLTTYTLAIGTTDDWSITHEMVDYGDGTPAVDLIDPGVLVDPAHFVGSHTFPHPGMYPVTLTVTDDGGNTATTSRQVTVGSAFVQSGPTRFLDTRAGIGAPKGQVGAGGVVRLKVAGVGGVPADGVTAVTLNLTGTGATADTWVGAYPDGSPLPTASTLNFGPGRTEPNLVTVPVSADGYVDLYNHSGSVDLVADVEGYYSTTATNGAFVTANAPTRVLDSRYGIGTGQHGVGPGGVLSLQLPANSYNGASAVILNVTETDATAAGWVGVVPAGGGLPGASSLNFVAGQTSANLVVAPIGPGGQVQLYNHSGNVDLIADVEGYVGGGDPASSAIGSAFLPVTPTRVLNTRQGIGAPQTQLTADSTLKVKVAGVNGIPSGVNAVLLNLTGVGCTAGTWLSASAHTDGAPRPTTSDLNLDAGQTNSNNVLVPVSPDGYIDIYNRSGSVDVIADIQGYYAN